MSDREDVIAQYAQLFRGRGDALGWWDGGCEHLDPPLNPNTWLDRVRNHLTSTDPADWFGVYMHLGAAGNQRCSWGCIDIDGKDHPTDQDGVWDWEDMTVIATNLHNALAMKGIHTHHETTANGIHLWVFPTNPVPAADMRRALMAACKAIGYQPKEINPKQEELPAGKIGNYVRLPYYGVLADANAHQLQPNRYFINLDDLDNLDPHGSAYMGIRDFLDSVAYTRPADLAATALLWTPPVVNHQVNDDAGIEAEAILHMLDGLSYTIWKDGPLPGKDRSNTLVHLAHLCSERGLTVTQAFVVVKSADARWGKHYLRPNCDELIRDIVEKVYAT